MSGPGPFDPGLQVERTELAWRRTALAIAIGSLLSLRVLPLALPEAAVGWGFAPGLAGLLAACALWFAARRRQLRLSAVLAGDGAASRPGGRLLFALTAFGTGFGVLALLFATMSAL
ncbi:hypothetical protein MHM582_0889 [Microbacterium sp. HM58-2]|nr:hypothetical protein MHM582_0889 [Microbacterium sp. HM58-2]